MHKITVSSQCSKTQACLIHTRKPSSAITCSQHINEFHKTVECVHRPIYPPNIKTEYIRSIAPVAALNTQRIRQDTGAPADSKRVAPYGRVTVNGATE